MADETADDRWTVRGVPKTYRDRAADAAARRKVAVGAYLCQALDLLLQAEREPHELIEPIPLRRRISVGDNLVDVIAPTVDSEMLGRGVLCLAG